ncbi:MAG: 1-deoxy-D-xylulose-5-phosphate synthase [Desulfuromonas sp. SDB]|nr:MAG: 1-deoxy-D-xylulose-5-phosphate synthase [Desulfuromonas sp. SDB]
MIDWKNYKLLSEIENPRDLKNLSVNDLKHLAQELRDVIIEVVSKNGGHLASNLGSIELTLALLKTYNPPEDLIVWDVGHQAYAYKILTSRKQRFDTIRKYQGLSGFPKRSESEYDAYGVGHASTAISASLGMSLGRDLKGQKKEIVAIVGDGALTGGLSWEGLNQVSAKHANMTVVINDNGMSISENVGMISNYLNKLVTAPVYNRLREDVWELLGLLPSFLSKRARDVSRRLEEGVKNFLVPTILFEELGFRYIGPVNGHDVRELVDIFKGVQRIRGPKVVHVLTQKGRGYEHAEKDPETFHGIGPFKVESGDNKKKATNLSWTEVFSQTLVEVAENDQEIVAITAAMPLGTGLDRFAQKFPHRFIDVGIAEGHAVTLAGGLATQGLKPAVAIYSTFLQRAYDQVIHDIALQELPVSFFLDRAGIVGEDGPTHHGCFDISYLLAIPNLVIMAPADYGELTEMIKLSFNLNQPTVVRYPRGKINYSLKSKFSPKISLGKAEMLKKGSEIVLMAVGNMVHTALELQKKITRDDNIGVTVVNLRFVKPLDPAIWGLAKQAKLVVTLEEGSVINGISSFIAKSMLEQDILVPFQSFGIPDQFVQHGSTDELLQFIGLDEHSIYNKIITRWKSLNVNEP